MNNKKQLKIILLSFLIGFLFHLYNERDAFLRVGYRLVSNQFIVHTYHGLRGGYIFAAFVSGGLKIKELFVKSDKTVKIIMIIALPILLFMALWIGCFIWIPVVAKDIKALNAYNKEKHKEDLVIKPAYGNVLITIAVIIVQILCYIKLHNRYLDQNIFGYLMYWGIMVVWDIHLWANVILDCRRIVMDKDGCTLQILWLKKRYKWKEIAVKRLEYGYRNLNGSIPMGGVFFSIKLVNKDIKKDPRKFCLYKNPFQFFYVYLKTGKVYSFHSQTCIDREMFFKKMSLWGVQLTIAE